MDDRLDAGQLRQTLAAALASLSEDYREALLLVAWEQLTPAEVAQALGLPPSTVRSRLHRARLILQRAFDTAQSFHSEPTDPIYQEA